MSPSGHQLALKLRGKIVPGVGEGKEYLSIPEYTEQFTRLLHTPPFPGTLNIRLEGIGSAELEDIEKLKEHKGILINGFEKDGKEYYPGISLPCTLLIGKEEINGLLFFPEKTAHSPVIVEVISRVRIMDFAAQEEMVELKIG
ncbi:MAG: DUF120 domain-containing protein [Thermoplasmata archaeon]|nr:DUF120 domain-containing protein [Thermoplasmata archaeon]